MPDGQILCDLDSYMKTLARDTIPLLPLGQGRGCATDTHRRHVQRAAHGNTGRAALQAQWLLRNAARTFGENDQIIASTDRSDAVIDQAGSAVVGNIAASAHGAAKKEVACRRRFDDAVGVGQQRHQEHHVEQGGVIGQYQQPLALQAFTVMNFPS